MPLPIFYHQNLRHLIFLITNKANQPGIDMKVTLINKISVSAELSLDTVTHLSTLFGPLTFLNPRQYQIGLQLLQLKYKTNFPYNGQTAKGLPFACCVSCRDLVQACVSCQDLVQCLREECVQSDQTNECLSSP